MTPFGVISDSHTHKWSQFATVLPNGLNSRLNDILVEIRQAARDVKAAGGDTLYHCGDLFHVRGSVSPEVTNPLIDTVLEIVMDGVKLVILTGNHDLESRNSNAASSACEMLRTLPDVTIVTSPTVFWGDKVAMVPWYDNLDEVRAKIKVVKDLIELGDADNGIPPSDISEFSLMLHAPVNGVLIGIPDAGFYSKELEVLGFKYVFSGHYHAHKEFPGNVFSVGATTHQTWNDVGTKSGHLIVTPAGVDHVSDKAPKFINYDLSWDAFAAAAAVDGNFVRVVLGTATEEDIEFIRDQIMADGAKGVTVNAIPVPKGTVTTRTAPVASAVVTTRDSVKQWIDTDTASEDPAFINDVQALAKLVMDETESVTV